MPNIRKITPEELPSLVELGWGFVSDSNIHGSFDAAHFIRTWNNLIKAGIGHIYVIFSEENEPNGCIGIITHPDVNDGKLVAQETFWFMKPDVRGAGLRLYRHLMNEVVKMGCKRMIMVHLNNYASSTLKKLYIRDGFTEAETSYVKILE